MKMTFLKVIICIFSIASFISGCVYFNVQAPLDTDYDKTDLGTKIGKSNAQSVCWLVAWGNAGTKAAAAEGNITVIKHADSRLFSVFFGFYTKLTTIVYGD